MTAYPPLPPKPPRRPFWTRGRLAIVGAVIASGTAAGIALTVSHDDTGTDDSPTTSQAASDPHKKCVTSWNTDNPGKETVAGLGTVGTQSDNATAYVNVSFSKLFPDRCLITVANPTTMTAQQYVQEATGTWTAFPAWSGSANQLDDTVTAWNAEMSKSGVITLN